MERRAEAERLRDSGLTQKQVAREMGISYEGVRQHLSASRRKLRSRRVAEHRVALKAKALDHSGGRCLACGYGECNGALEFHHLDPSVKEHGIGNGAPYAWRRQLIEIQKTILLCCRCHREHHFGVLDITADMIERQAAIRSVYVDRPIIEYKRELRLAHVGVV